MRERIENLNIGIIGPLDSCKKISEVIKKYFPKLTAKIYAVSKIEEAYLEIEKSQKECEGLVFTGVGVYSKVIEKVDPSVPYVYTPFLTSSIMKSLWELKEKFPYCKNISIDIVKKSEVKDILEELNLNDINVQAMDYNHLYTEQDYVDFHVTMHEKEEVSVSIIGLGWVYEEVKKKGYPAIRLYSTKSAIKSTINDLLYKIKEAEAKEATMVVQLLSVKNQENISQYKALEIRTLIESNLVGYLKEIQGSIFNLKSDQYIIFSTRGAIENTENLVKLKNTLDYLEKNNIKIFVGTGLGRTAYESEINARKALQIAAKEEKSCIFKVDGNKIEGPLLEEEELTYNLTMDNSEVEEMAELINLNPLYIRKINAIKEKYSKDTFTSEELAQYLNISIRSANRIIKKILDNNCGEVVGLESNNSLGRPKKIIKINFDKN
ncbi:hypothetical protein KQI86_04790 [Clostridium sp. MSJ-11]|uniref:Transcriptional regulator n=1 Tax=Clostridium mobile TaxID=2841512 RepID=A0ABS6EEK0_9CLOT|nr:hypothetical protein [Clostridium mobile]MBU5483636.1 hypothetical protein [Clostridium mobile]